MVKQFDMGNKKTKTETINVHYTQWKSAHVHVGPVESAKTNLLFFSSFLTTWHNRALTMLIAETKISLISC